jgi:hypothetical protein
VAQGAAPLTTKSTSRPSQAEQRSPIDDGGIGAIARDLVGDGGLGPVLTSLAPHDQVHLGRERLAEGHRRGLAVASFPPHNSAAKFKIVNVTNFSP